MVQPSVTNDGAFRLLAPLRPDQFSCYHSRNKDRNTSKAPPERVLKISIFASAPLGTETRIFLRKPTGSEVLVMFQTFSGEQSSKQRFSRLKPPITFDIHKYFLVYQVLQHKRVWIRLRSISGIKIRAHPVCIEESQIRLMCVSIS